MYRRNALSLSLSLSLALSLSPSLSLNLEFKNDKERKMTAASAEWQSIFSLLCVYILHFNKKYQFTMVGDRSLPLLLSSSLRWSPSSSVHCSFPYACILFVCVEIMDNFIFMFTPSSPHTELTPRLLFMFVATTQSLKNILQYHVGHFFWTTTKDTRMNFMETMRMLKFLIDLQVVVTLSSRKFEVFNIYFELCIYRCMVHIYTCACTQNIEWNFFGRGVTLQHFHQGWASRFYSLVESSVNFCYYKQIENCWAFTVFPISYPRRTKSNQGSLQNYSSTNTSSKRNKPIYLGLKIFPAYVSPDGLGKGDIMQVHFTQIQLQLRNLLNKSHVQRFLLLYFIWNI